jgi:hypothetical protein
VENRVSDRARRIVALVMLGLLALPLVCYACTADVDPLDAVLLRVEVRRGLLAHLAFLCAACGVLVALRAWRALLVVCVFYGAYAFATITLWWWFRWARSAYATRGLHDDG